MHINFLSQSRVSEWTMLSYSLRYCVRVSLPSWFIYLKMFMSLGCWSKFMRCRCKSDKSLAYCTCSYSFFSASKETHDFLFTFELINAFICYSNMNQRCEKWQKTPICSVRIAISIDHENLCGPHRGEKFPFETRVGNVTLEIKLKKYMKWKYIIHVGVERERERVRWNYIFQFGKLQQYVI